MFSAVLCDNLEECGGWWFKREGTYVYLRLIHGFHPWSGILRSCVLLGMAKKNPKKLKMYIKTSILDKIKNSLLQ